jgi:hypothetical protein
MQRTKLNFSGPSKFNLITPELAISSYENQKLQFDRFNRTLELGEYSRKGSKESRLI